MDLESAWNKALKQTEIIRTRIQNLYILSDTHVPYILLSESVVNIGDTIVRKGNVVVKKPSLIIPPNNPQFKGFEFNNETLGLEPDSVINFLLVRGVSLPSFQYDNKTSSLDIFEGKLSAAVKHYNEALQKNENVNTGLITCPEDCWQLSLLIFVCMQIAKNAESDFKKLLEDYKKFNK